MSNRVFWISRVYKTCFTQVRRRARLRQAERAPVVNYRRSVQAESTGRACAVDSGPLYLIFNLPVGSSQPRARLSAITSGAAEGARLPRRDTTAAGDGKVNHGQEIAQTAGAGRRRDRVLETA